MASEFPWGTEDIEREVLAIPLGSSDIHDQIRTRIHNRDWWILLGFASEAIVEEIFDRIAAVITVDTDVARVGWPLIRTGEHSGTREDHLLILFARKNSISREMILDVCSKFCTKPLPILIPGDSDQDCIAISWGYCISLVMALQRFLEAGAHGDN